MKIKDGKLLYHLTTLDVFKSIVANKLLSRGDLNRQNLDFVDTANPEILEGRERLGLADYIPFHFHIHTNYDTYVKGHNPEQSFIYLCLSRAYAQSNGFSILPIHPTSSIHPHIYSYDEGINAINWDIMELRKTDPLPFGVTEQQRGLIRMAKCLSPSPLPINVFKCIYVKNDDNASYVTRVLQQYGIQTNPPYINIQPKYF